MSRGVPVELTTFVGRRQELSEGRRMLRTARVVTLVGPGGVGKTRLATRLAHQVRRVFRDGVVWIDLAAYHEPASLMSEVASALGVEPQGQPVGEAVAAYLSSRELLVVLDNCEHLVDACAHLVAELLKEADGLRVVTTSREALRIDGEHLMRVEPLAVPSPEESAAGAIGQVDAVVLLTERARSVHPDFKVDAANVEAAARLCRRLDGIPLAIELAAARLRVLSLGQLADRLDERFDLLTAGPRAALPRHQTLRGMVEWSHELCSPAEQALWARLSVFEGGADLDAVAAVCGETGPPTLEVLAGLVDKSVVTVSETGGRVRFRMLETIREYGAERLADRGESELIQDRHLDHYLAVARESRAAWFGPDQLNLLNRTASDLGNLRAAFDHALSKPGEQTTALELASAMAWYWHPAGALDEGARWFAGALPEGEPEDEVASSALLRALADAFQLAGLHNDVETGLRLGRRAVTLPAPEPTSADRAARHLSRALLATITGDQDDALAENTRALHEFRAAGDLLRQAEVLQGVAAVMSFLGRHEEAITFVEEAMRLCDAHGERFERRTILEFYGALQRRLGREEKGLAALRASLTAWPVPHPVHVANALWAISRIHATADEEARAAVLLGARVRIRDEFGYELSPYYVTDGFEPFGKRLSGALGEEAFRSAYDEGYAMPLEEAVQFALGEEATARPRPQVGGASPLSKREQQVAGLVARGFSNKDIAGELVISQRTAEGHVAKIMDRLGVSSRSQVASWVAEQRAGEP